MREIFGLATTGEASEPRIASESNGLTLEEVTQIGLEAGIEPARIAEAAASLDIRSTPMPVRRSFGLPIGVSRVVDLPRAPTDREWEQLITECRTTFQAQGRVTSSGGLREWSQGNLHVSVEPTAHGERLRLSTLKGDAVSLNALGLVMAGMAVAMGSVAAAAGKPEKVLALVSLFGLASLASFGVNLFRLPRWAREREQQMKAISEHAVRMLAAPANDRLAP